VETRLAPLLAVRDLRVTFRRGAASAIAVDGVSLSIAPGETLGLVGESGCGKSVTALAIMGLLPAAIARVSGRILFEGVDLLRLSRRALRRLRGRRIGMIFQEPMRRSIRCSPWASRLRKPFARMSGCTRRAAHERAIAALAEVGIAEARRRAGRLSASCSRAACGSA
jgi:peptide/nickel transport system ATP-binding protein